MTAYHASFVQAHQQAKAVQRWFDAVSEWGGGLDILGLGFNVEPVGIEPVGSAKSASLTLSMIWADLSNASDATIETVIQNRLKASWENESG